MKIAILIRQETADRCIGKGCLSAFHNRKDAFSHYTADTELIGFTHTGGDLDHKINRLLENGVETIHLSSCLRAKCEAYEALARRLSLHFSVVGYTHGSEAGQKRMTCTLSKDLPPVNIVEKQDRQKD